MIVDAGGGEEGVSVLEKTIYVAGAALAGSRFK
jgi:Ethanolamine utilization protein EutJ (predicted chaperonin)